MWILVEPDKPSAVDDHGQTSRPSATLASHLPDLNEADIDAALLQPSGRRTWFWRMMGYSTLSLMLAAGLAAQVGYRHLDSISQHETIRPWLLSFCDIARCVLPSRQDSSLVISNQLSIVPHPAYQDISQMILRFTNTAGFPQPLPAIELMFWDTDGSVVAGRRFYPRHYLNESQATQTAFSMSAGESLTAHVDFATPADEAVNYQVRFVYE